jgi:transcriptional regulator with XRE-family HTH domain
MSDAAKIWAAIGERVRLLRGWRGVDVETVASAINVAREKLIDIEDGNINITFDVILKIAIALRVRPGYFLIDLQFLSDADEAGELILSCIDLIDQIALKRQLSAQRGSELSAASELKSGELILNPIDVEGRASARGGRFATRRGQFSVQ